MLDDPFAIRNVTSHEAAQANNNVDLYTIFNRKNVYRNDPRQLLELVEAIGARNIADVVSYRPQRQAFHWTAAYLNLTAYVKRDGELEKLIRDVYDIDIASDHNMLSLFKAIDNERVELIETVRNAIQEIQSGQPPSGSTLDTTVRRIYDEVNERIGSHQYSPGQSNPGETLGSVVEKLAVDTLCNSAETCTVTLRNSVTKKIDALEECGQIVPLKPCDKRYPFICIAAAPGSGKSTVTEILQHQFYAQGVAVLTGDNFRRVLLDDPDGSVKKAGSITKLSRDEMSEVKRKMQIAYLTMLDSGRKLPTVIWEQTLIRDTDFIKQVLGKLKQRGETAYVYAINLPVETAMKRALTRAHHAIKANDRAKYIEPQEMLAFHKQFGSYLEGLLLGKNNQDLVFELLDNEVLKGKNPRTIAFGRTAETKDINIIDIDKFSDYLKKRFLNDNATSAEKIYADYTGNVDHEIKEIIMEFAKEYTLNLVDEHSNLIYGKIKSDGVIELYDNSRVVSNPALVLFDVKPVSRLTAQYATRSNDMVGRAP